LKGEEKMKHKCENFIEASVCTKCGKPEWALYYPEFDHLIGTCVRLPSHYNGAGKKYFVLKKSKYGYTLGEQKNPKLTIEWFDWWELYPI